MIQVQQRPNTQTITVQSGYIEDGEFILEHCNHAGAEYQDMEFIKTTWWQDAGIYVPDDLETKVVLVCNKCNSYQAPDGEWIGQKNYDTTR